VIGIRQLAIARKPTPEGRGLAENPKCQLCEERGSMSHVLSSYKTALIQGRYRWRHDQLLRELADVLEVKTGEKDNWTKQRCGT